MEAGTSLDRYAGGRREWSVRFEVLAPGDGQGPAFGPAQSRECA
jgi:hypothetical protein